MKKTNVNQRESNWKDDVLLPLKIIRNCKLEMFISFLSSFIFGQVALVISIILYVFFCKKESLENIINNGDLLTVSLALLGTYFGILAMDFGKNSYIVLKGVKIAVISFEIFLSIIILIFLLPLKYDEHVIMTMQLAVAQIVAFIITLLLSIYSLCLLNVNKCMVNEEMSENQNLYLDTEKQTIKDLKERAKVDETEEGDLL